MKGLLTGISPPWSLPAAPRGRHDAGGLTKSVVSQSRSLNCSSAMILQVTSVHGYDKKGVYNG